MARDDVYMPRRSSRSSGTPGGEPPIEWIPGGHMTFPLSLRQIIARMRHFHAGLRTPRTASFASLQS